MDAAQAAIAVDEPPAAEMPAAELPRREKPAASMPKKLPPYAVVVINDDLHTFQYVIESFREVFRYPGLKCFLGAA